MAVNDHIDAIRAAQLMEVAADCTAVPWQLRGGWGVAIRRQRGRRDFRWTGPVEQGWAWLRPAPAEAPVAEALPVSSATGQDPAGEAAAASASPAGQDG